MSAVNYSEAQIEEKRLLALRRKAEKEARSSDEFDRRINSTSARYGSSWNSASSSASSSSSSSSSRSSPKSGETSVGATRTPKRYGDRPSPLRPRAFFGSNPILVGNCTVTTETRFTVDVEYNSELVETFKTVSSRLYDQKSRRWSFHVSDYEKLMERCRRFLPRIAIEGIPRYVLEVFRRNASRKSVGAESRDLSSIDDALTGRLMPFQREGICYGISKNGRCFIADDMGLGKTIQALGLAHYYRENWPLLVVTPSSVRYQWSEAIFTFLPSVPIQYVQHFTSGKDFVGDARITIVSYDLLVRSIKVFERQAFGFVILDESHTVKSGKTARTRAVQTIASQARHVVLLSGTPAVSRPIELYSQISLVVPSFMGFHDYGVRYCNATRKAYGWDYSGSSNTQELHLLLRSCCMIRRLKSDVLKQLPAKIRQVVLLDPTLISGASEEGKSIAEKLNSARLKSAERESAILRYYHESSERRIKAVRDYVSDLLEGEQKFLIYAHHRSVLDSISELLASKNIGFIRIDGKTLPEQRKAGVDRFQESEDCVVAVLSITAANAGITLTAARLVVFAELFWNPGILCQAEDRAHRIGQDSSVVIRYLVATDTADDHLWPLIQRKIDTLRKVGLDQNFSLSQADVLEQKINDESAILASSGGQTRMDSFLATRPGGTTSQKSHLLDEAERTDGNVAAAAAACSDDLNRLLELDEADFDDIDLDNIS